MSSPIKTHMDQVVLPALRDYWAAEGALSEAAGTADPGMIAAARAEALRRARTAATELHHLSDFVLNTGSPELPPLGSLEAVRATVAAQCVHLRGDAHTPDVALLRDVADSFKHHQLDRKGARVREAKAVVACQSGFGQLGWGEGKFGGTDQVVVTTVDGTQRALTSVLQNVVDAWRGALGQELPPMNVFD